MIEALQGDVIDVLRDEPDESYTACLCDPPYRLSKHPDMAEARIAWWQKAMEPTGRTEPKEILATMKKMKPAPLFEQKEK